MSGINQPRNASPEQAREEGRIQTGGIIDLLREGWRIDRIVNIGGVDCVLASREPREDLTHADQSWKSNRAPSRFFDIKSCARCGKDHTHLQFWHFTRKTTIDFVEYHYWTLCPSLREPIVMSIQSDTDASPEVQS